MSPQDPQRLEVVRDLAVMDDTSNQEAYDRIARIAQEVFDVPVVLITFMDGQRQWFKSHLGTDRQENTPDQSFCRVPIATKKTTVVENALGDDRFCGLQDVIGGPALRFYAGAPLMTHDGFAIGTLCLFDIKQRSFTPDQIRMLEDLAAVVMIQVKSDRAIGRVDPLTRLPNRIQFLLSLQDMVRADPSSKCWIVLVDVIDNRHAEDVIGALGIDFYNEQVRHAAAILKRRLTNRTIYHVGGAYLVFMLEDLDDEPQALINQLDDDLREPLVTSRGTPSALNPCFGLRRAGLMEMASPDVLRTVLSAAREARLSESLFATYNVDQDTAQKRMYSLLSDLPEALRSHKQLYLVYQPRIDVASGRCIAAEALLRWNHPRWGAVSPAELFPLVDKTGLIHEVTDWVMRNVMRQIAAWQAAGIDLSVSFNISSKNLFEDDLVSRLAEVLNATGVDPSRLEIEVVEDMNLDNSHIASERLKEIRELGVSVAIDDFGSGYSNLAYLLSLPASSLKIDRSLVAQALTDPNAAVTVPTVIKLGHDLGYHMVAEGVERPETFEQLKAWGCDEVQGYLFGRPMEPVAFESWLTTSHQPSLASA
ncbi:EAL domain-containing protein [Tianweitania populi]|uniref:Sensor domain-containing phosphodiesterase n=1 Tax=Tianweitania populi TaxID=1607949 RepID=A0A8J3DX01_9HYPH|nr:GGDEF and EAL domain-containing protein [Tianweitania populi]GHD18954.1 sensor domain-containing phosphodiesterase [Tianweitania populi]